MLAAIALGGALGAPARYGVAQLVHGVPGAFPWATFWTNISGSFALGFFLVLVLERFPPTRYLRPFVATGFLGAYTTYSTFSFESVRLMEEGAFVEAFLSTFGTVVSCAAAAALGLLLASA